MQSNLHDNPYYVTFIPYLLLSSERMFLEADNFTLYELFFEALLLSFSIIIDNTIFLITFERI